MDCLTEEELFELQHQDELDVIDDTNHLNSQCDIFDYMFKKESPVLSKKTLNNEACNTQRNILETLTENSDYPKEVANDFENLKDVHSEDKTPEKIFEEKENTPVSLPVKRKLTFTEEFSQNNSKIASVSQEFDCEDSENLLKETPKRKISELSDSLSTTDAFHSAKKKCTSVNEEFEKFLNGCLSSQARPSLFNEVRMFLKDQFTVTCSDGQRRYFEVHEDDDLQNTVTTFSERTNSLLSVPIDVLKTQYFLMEEENSIRQQNETPNLFSTTGANMMEEKETENSLWVEKYQPTSYMNLLSEEGINRTLLHWLKLWDKVVFGREKKVKKKKVPDQKKNFQNPKFQKLGELIEELDEHGRPHHKVAFLCGPPGLGKTTLAIIIAKHAGYNVVELNASDDRNPDTFRTNLEAATQMKAVLHEDHKPNCLILDEIDGAPAPSINVLLSFIKSTGFVKGKRKKGDIPLLMRPIICICNDQYSPALKPLRQLSLILNFPPTTTSRLANRLYEIATKEGLMADMAALTLLCEKSGNDIRSCLSTLQFIHRMKKSLKVSDIEGMTIGQKDMQKSLFAVWQDVFYCTDKPSFDKIYNIINSFGDYDKVYIGLFENYVNIKFKHRNADSVWSGAEWLCFGDIIQQQILHHQFYYLLSYLPYPPVAFHVMFSSNTFPHISYPSAFYEYKAKSSQLSNTLTSMVKDMVTTMRTFFNTNVLLIDIFPFLLEIIKPNLRPVNTQLYSEREKNELLRVIELMLAFNLNYRQERLQDGTYMYILDPNIEELTKFSGIKCNKPLTYSAKQMIAREVEMEQMRKGDANEVVTVSQREKKKPVPPPKSEPVKKHTTVEKPMVDFFGRVILEDTKQKKKVKLDPRDEQVWFHFKEGYTNAVRRPVLIKDLM